MWFFRETTNIDVSVFMFDLRVINMSFECEYDWYWKISACSTECEVCDSFASLTRHQASYSGSAGCYFRYQSIHIQITYTSLFCVRFTLFIFNDMYTGILSGCEWIDTENISLPSQNMKFVGEWAKRTSHKLHILSSRLIFFSINHIHIQMTCLSSLNQT